MSLYPAWLSLKVAIKRGAIALHLIHPPSFSFTPHWTPSKGVCARYEGGDDGSPINLVIRSGVKNAAQLSAALASGAKVIALVETLDNSVVDSLVPLTGTNPANLVAIELGNEIDLTSATPQQFADFLVRNRQALRHTGYTGDIIIGGISRVRPDTLNWLKKVLTCGYMSDFKDLIIGIHRYSINNDANIPQAGYVNRDEECSAILEVANGRDVAITEFGYPLLDGSSQADLEQVKVSVNVDIHWWIRMGAKYAIYYQWLNGPTNTPIDRFGIKDRPTILELLS